MQYKVQEKTLHYILHSWHQYELPVLVMWKTAIMIVDPSIMNKVI